MSDYKFKTKPFAHQLETFVATRDMEDHGIFWEQGTGKSKLMIDTAAYLYEKGCINAVLIVAPNGTHQNWVFDEFPAHLPDRLRDHIDIHDYQSSKASTKWHTTRCKQILHHNGLSVLCMAYSGFTTAAGSKYAKQFLAKRKVMYVIDEGHHIKEPKTKRSRWIVASGKHAAYRRVLTGTPIANGPFDMYALVRFLEPAFWKEHGLGSYGAFKTHFGIWEEGYRPNGTYQKLVAYKNLDELKDLVSDISSRVEKSDVLDLPPKLYSKRYFDLTPEQARLYKGIEEDHSVFTSSGEEVMTPLALVRLLRLQQIICGYLPTDSDEEPTHFIPGPNPRLQLLASLCENTPHKAIIWARFRLDIEAIMEFMKIARLSAVRYDGTTSSEDRQKAKMAFQTGDAQFFVANPAAAGEGLTLNAARTVIYYSNSFKLVERLQSEDRAHRIGQEHPVSYIDLVASNTVDSSIVSSLRSKLDIATYINGDTIKSWL